MSDLEREMCDVLMRLELTSVSRARVYAGVTTSSAPDSAPPTGDVSPAEHWRDAFNAAAPDERLRVFAGARDELERIKRRRFPLMPIHDGDDLRERIVRDGEGLEPREVATPLRCTPTLVRRARLVAGREPERGKLIALIVWDTSSLLAAGLSLRQVAACSGVPRSTLHDRRRAMPP